MHWKDFFFLNTNTDGATTKETYGFKWKRSPPHVKELDQFKDSFLDMIQSIQFKANHHQNNLQRKLRNDITEIRTDKHVFVKADKTTNYYKTTPEEYMRLLNKNLTKAEKKTDLNVPNAIATKDKQIAEKLGLDDRIDVSAHRDSYITMKDHKQDFVNNPACDSSIQARLKLALSVNTC